MVNFAFLQIALSNWLRLERSDWLVRPVNILRVVWLAWLLAGLGWLLFPQLGSMLEVQLRASAPTPVRLQRRQPEIDERQVAAWHIFGVTGEDPPEVKYGPDAPETSLELTLRGVFASEDPGKARAIIGDLRGQEEHYAVGHPLPGNARLKAIYPDPIILERNSRYETLRLPRDQMSSDAVAEMRHEPPPQLASETVTDLSGLPGDASAITPQASLLSYGRMTPESPRG